MTAGCSRFLSVGEYVYREPSVSAHFWQTAFIVRQSLKKPPAMQVDNNRFSLQ